MAQVPVSAGGEIARLVDQFERAYSGEAWHGMPVRELLSDVDATLAAAHPVAGGHSIWELVTHITWWLDAARRRVGGEAVESVHDEDWPATPAPTEAAWTAARAALQAGHDRLVAAIGRLEPKDLDGPAPGRPYSVYVLLHGVLQHTLYHGGQIGLLRRAGRG